jgi:futalosine hydrolase
MKILIAAATPFEIGPLQQHLEQHFVPSGPSQYQRGPTEVSVLITGVGLPLMAYAMGRVLGAKEFGLAINAGIAGAFQPHWEIGQVVQVVSERFADLGVQEADGRFTDVHELELIGPEQSPFTQGRLLNPRAEGASFLPQAHGLSVNKVHGYPPDIAAIRQKYPDADVESMEGAAFFYACLLENIPFLEIRAISNRVEARNRANWDLPLAIGRLNEVLVEMVGAVGG